ncbi:MAG: glycoside hydrolase family 28 protein [Lachnospiraceae bacterium]
MKLKLTGSFARSATFELDEPGIYQQEAPFAVTLNGTKILETRNNVFSLYHLEPDTSYTVAAGEGDSLSFRTKKESVFLDVTRFGASGDGKKDDTAFLQAALSACPKDGTVYIPAGTYLTGPLFPKSNQTIYLERGAVLLGKTDRTAYPILPGTTKATDETSELFLGTWEGNPLDSFASLLTLIGITDTDITGEGMINGNAASGDWWENAKKRRIAWRPNLIFLMCCERIRFQGLAIQNSPSWTVHPCYSKDLLFADLTIQNPPDSPNTDGFDPESCKNVQLLGTKISVGDDCVAIKSGKYYMAAFHRQPCTGITIRNCLFERGHGSVTIGSEIAGGVSSVSVSRCLFSGTDRGVRVKTRRGRGQSSCLTDLVFEDISMNDVAMPFTINMFYFCDPDGHTEYVQDPSALPVDERTPKIGEVLFRNITCTGADAVILAAAGLPESPIGEIRMEHIKAAFLPEEKMVPLVPLMRDNCPKMAGRGILVENADRVILRDVEVKGSHDTAPELTGVKNAILDQTRFA